METRPDDASSPEPLRHGATTRAVLAIFFNVYNELGSGFLESIYQTALTHALTEGGHRCRREAPVEVRFRGVVIGRHFTDLIVDDCVIVEMKAARKLLPEHRAQLLHYLRATSIEVGVLLNFGPSPEFHRLILTNDRKPRAPSQ